MRKLILLLLLAVGLLSNLQAEEKVPEMPRYTSAYSGGEGYRVWVARFGPREQQEALVQIEGIDHKLDGRVLRAKAMPSAGGVKYTAMVDGQSYELLYVDGKNAELRLTGAPWSEYSLLRQVAGRRQAAAAPADRVSGNDAEAVRSTGAGAITFSN
jgi:hypothetical protein